MEFHPDHFHVPRLLAVMALFAFVGGLFFAMEGYEENRNFERQDVDQHWERLLVQHYDKLKITLRRAIWCFGTSSFLLLAPTVWERIREMVHQ